MFQINQMDVVSLYGSLPITFTVYDVVFFFLGAYSFRVDQLYMWQQIVQTHVDGQLDHETIYGSPYIYIYMYICICTSIFDIHMYIYGDLHWHGCKLQHGKRKRDANHTCNCVWYDYPHANKLQTYRAKKLVSICMEKAIKINRERERRERGASYSHVRVRLCHLQGVGASRREYASTVHAMTHNCFTQLFHVCRAKV
jgi:hypothetical protein